MRDKKGFTLVEIMLVVIIIGTLAAMILPRLAGMGRKAKEKVVQGEIHGISTALDTYEIDCGFYPTDQQGLDVLMKKSSTSPTSDDWDGPYLKKEPIDPWGSKYQYRRRDAKKDGRDYDIWSLGVDKKDGTDDDICSWGKE